MQMGQQDSSLRFKKGITLEEYMKSSQNLLEDVEESSEEDLYASYKLMPAKQIKLTTFAIHEIDEDNYEQQTQNHSHNQYQAHNNQYTKQQNHAKLVPPTQSIHQLNLENDSKRTFSINDKSIKLELNDTKGFRVRNNSNSPKKQGNEKKQMFRSLYGNNFGRIVFRPSEPSIFSSTIHNKFYKLAANKDSTKRQADFKEKNKKHYNEVIKYQNVVRNKYYNKLDLLNIRIDGVKDRLCERKNPHKP